MSGALGRVDGVMVAGTHGDLRHNCSTFHASLDCSLLSLACDTTHCLARIVDEG